MLFLLHQDLGFEVLERLEDVRVEEGVADVDQLDLQCVDVLVQTEQLEHFINGTKLELGHQPAGQLLGIIAEATIGYPGNPSQ